MDLADSALFVSIQHLRWNRIIAILVESSGRRGGFGLLHDAGLCGVGAGRRVGQVIVETCPVSEGDFTVGASRFCWSGSRKDARGRPVMEAPGIPTSRRRDIGVSIFWRPTAPLIYDRPDFSDSSYYLDALRRLRPPAQDLWWGFCTLLPRSRPSITELRAWQKRKYVSLPKE